MNFNFVMELPDSFDNTDRVDYRQTKQIVHVGANYHMFISIPLSSTSLAACVVVC